MARNSQTFEIGNHAARAGLKLTAEIHELFVNTVRQTGRLSIAAGRCCVSPSTVRDWLRKGRIEKAESPFKEFADAVEKTRAEYLAVAAGRMGTLAIGGTLTLPKYDKFNNLIRDKNGNVQFEERYFPPDQRALAHILDRLDLEPNLEPQQLGLPEPAAELTDAEEARCLDAFREGLEILHQLGATPSWAREAIETTAVKPQERLPEGTVSPAEPEKSD